MLALFFLSIRLALAFIDTSKLFDKYFCYFLFTLYLFLNSDTLNEHHF